MCLARDVPGWEDLRLVRQMKDDLDWAMAHHAESEQLMARTMQ
jgi:hypothetical protein